MKKNEEGFFAELGRVPSAPGDLYGSVSDAISRRRKTGFLWAGAASLLLAAGSALVWMPRNSTTVAVDPDVDEELRSVVEFISGDSIETEMDMYALVDWSGF